MTRLRTLLILGAVAALSVASTIAPAFAANINW